MIGKAIKIRKKSFTLIELLVVISIIAILASMMLPSLRRMKTKADALGCMNNLKQINSALFLYSSDFYDYAPEGFHGSNRTSWDDQLRIYIGGKELTSAENEEWMVPKSNEVSTFICPSDKRSGFDYLGVDRALLTYVTPGKGNKWSLNPASTEYYTSFLAYRQGSLNDTASPSYDHRRLSSVEDSGGAGFLMDGLPVGRGQVQGFIPVVENLTGGSDGDNYTVATLELHDMDVNWSFVDGHVSIYNIVDPDTYGTGTLASPAGFWTVTRGD